MLEIYQASVSNVKELKKQRKHLKRLFNRSIEKNDHSSFDALTKLYTLLYSSFAEVCFLKVIHTPYGFSEEEIKQILRQRNLDEKWEKCLELAFRKIDNLANKGEIQNKKLTLSKLIKDYIISVSQLRNKIAHGQWIVALNSENTAINPDTTKRIEEIDFVKTDILFEVYAKIGQAVEDLIESPHKAHFKFFFTHITELEVFVYDTKTWTLESKILHFKNQAKRHKDVISARRFSTNT